MTAPERYYHHAINLQNDEEIVTEYVRIDLYEQLNAELESIKGNLEEGEKV